MIVPVRIEPERVKVFEGGKYRMAPTGRFEAWVFTSGKWLKLAGAHPTKAWAQGVLHKWAHDRGMYFDRRAMAAKTSALK